MNDTITPAPSAHPLVPMREFPWTASERRAANIGQHYLKMAAAGQIPLPDISADVVSETARVRWTTGSADVYTAEDLMAALGSEGWVQQHKSNGVTREFHKAINSYGDLLIIWDFRR